MTVIPLGRASPHGSSHLPADSVGHVNVCLFGVAPRRDWPFHSSPLRRRHRHCSSNPRLTADGSYPLRCPVESRLSSAQPKWRSDRLACFTPAFYALLDPDPGFLDRLRPFLGLGALERGERLRRGG